MSVTPDFNEDFVNWNSRIGDWKSLRNKQPSDVNSPIAKLWKSVDASITPLIQHEINRQLAGNRRGSRGKASTAARAHSPIEEEDEPEPRGSRAKASKAAKAARARSPSGEEDEEDEGDE